MGNIFSNIESPADQLFSIEEKILNTEASLIKLRRNRFSTKLILFIVFLNFLMTNYYKISWLKSIFLIFFSLIFFILSATSFYKRRIRMAEYKLRKLKDEQKKIVKECSEDIMFAKTRRLIEKFEDEKSRKSFFSTVISKKKSKLDKIADFVLGKDPSKMNALICKFCGQHNGLIDPKNKEIELFYCYSCKQKNKREFIEMNKDK